MALLRLEGSCCGAFAALLRLDWCEQHVRAVGAVGKCFGAVRLEDR